MKRTLLKTTLGVLSALMLTACTQEAVPEEPPIQGEQQALLPFDIMNNGKISGIAVDSPTLFVFNDAPTFNSFWERHATMTPTPETPKLDFKTHTLVAIVDSDQPNGGYYLSFDKIERVGEELWIYVTRQQPGTECVNMGMIAQPYVMVSVEKTTLKPKLVFQTNQYPC